jgi:O-antigen ligase
MTMQNHVVTTPLFDRKRLGKCADWLAILVAVVLPWSTTFTQVAVLLWFATLVGSWNIAERCRERWMPAGALPVVLWALGAVGMLWASVPLVERFGGLNSFHKLLAIPFLAVQFRDSARGMWVLIGFLISCTLLLVLSLVLVLIPDLPWPGYHRVGGRIMIGIPVKDYISQSTVFTLCILGLAEGASFAWHKGSRRVAFAFILLAMIFLANILYVAVSRTALVALPILLTLFCFRRLGWKSTVGMMIGLTMFLATAWSTSPYLRERVTDLFDEVRNYQPSAVRTPAGERLEYWRKSIIIIMNAPFFGHGTGSIREQFRQLAVGQTGMAGLASANPHNQIFAITIQLGLVGTVALLAMWIAHFLFFFAPGLAAGIGLAVVVQNIVSSFFNSSLFDYNTGWVYALGVGVLGGMTLRALPTHLGGSLYHGPRS